MLFSRHKRMHITCQGSSIYRNYCKVGNFKANILLSKLISWGPPKKETNNQKYVDLIITKSQFILKLNIQCKSEIINTIHASID